MVIYRHWKRNELVTRAELAKELGEAVEPLELKDAVGDLHKLHYITTAPKELNDGTYLFIDELKSHEVGKLYDLFNSGAHFEFL